MDQPTEAEASDRAVAAGDAGFGGIAASLVQAATSMDTVGTAVENVGQVVGRTKRIVVWRIVADCIAIPVLVIMMILLLAGQSRQRHSSLQGRATLTQLTSLQALFNDCATPDQPAHGPIPAVPATADHPAIPAMPAAPVEIHLCYDQGVARTGDALKQIEIINISIGICAHRSNLPTTPDFVRCVTDTAKTVGLP